MLCVECGSVLLHCSVLLCLLNQSSTRACCVWNVTFKCGWCSQMWSVLSNVVGAPAVFLRKVELDTWSVSACTRWEGCCAEALPSELTHAKEYAIAFCAQAVIVGILWVVRVRGDDGELRPWHYIYVYSIESRLIRRVIYESKSRPARARRILHPPDSSRTADL